MAPLTSQKMEGFCLSIMEGKGLTESYRLHYGCDNQKDTTVNRNAKTLMDNSKIVTRLEELRAPIREQAGLTLKIHLDRLEVLSLAAEQEAQFGAAITAETNRGKASGLYVEKIDLNSKMTVTITNEDSKCL